jgi:nitric oxide synthase-interacting protein
MTRHSKRAGSMGSEALTYHERRALGFGTAKERLGKDSVGNFYDCRLTLAPAADPVASPAGFLFSREAIVENLLAQKKAIRRKLVAWEAGRAAAARRAGEEEAVRAGAELAAFDRRNRAGASDAAAARLRDAVAEEATALLSDAPRVAPGAANIRENAERAKDGPAFWVNSASGSGAAPAAAAERPSAETLCPASGRPLKLRDLVAVRFTPVPGGAGGSGGAPAYMDPLSHDPLTNASKLILLKPTGDVVTEDTWRRLIRPDGEYGGAAVGDDDVLELKGGGTGFAGHDGEAAQAATFFALGAGSGLAPLRGQRAGPDSRFGLAFRN